MDQGRHRNHSSLLYKHSHLVEPRERTAVERSATAKSVRRGNAGGGSFLGINDCARSRAEAAVAIRGTMLSSSTLARRPADEVGWGSESGTWGLSSV